MVACPGSPSRRKSWLLKRQNVEKVTVVVLTSLIYIPSSNSWNLSGKWEKTQDNHHCLSQRALWKSGNRCQIIHLPAGILGSSSGLQSVRNLNNMDILQFFLEYIACLSSNIKNFHHSSEQCFSVLKKRLVSRINDMKKMWKNSTLRVPWQQSPPKNWP